MNQRRIFSSREAVWENSRLKGYVICDAELDQISNQTCFPFSATSVKRFLGKKKQVGYSIHHEGEKDAYLVLVVFGKDGSMKMKSWTNPRGDNTRIMREVLPNEPLMCIWEAQVHAHAAQMFKKHQENVDEFMAESLVMIL